MKSQNSTFKQISIGIVSSIVAAYLIYLFIPNSNSAPAPVQQVIIHTYTDNHNVVSFSYPDIIKKILEVKPSSDKNRYEIRMGLQSVGFLNSDYALGRIEFIPITSAPITQDHWNKIKDVTLSKMKKYGETGFILTKEIEPDDKRVIYYEGRQNSGSHSLRLVEERDGILLDFISVVNQDQWNAYHEELRSMLRNCKWSSGRLRKSFPDVF